VKEWDDRPLPIELEVAFGMMVDSIDQRRRVNFLDGDGEELASVTGTLIGPGRVEQEGEYFAEFLVSDGGLSMTVRFALDPESRCTIHVDGTLIGVLPSGASWAVTPLAGD